MRIAVFNAKPYDQRFLDAANDRYAFDLHYLEPRLLASTARLAEVEVLLPLLVLLVYSAVMARAFVWRPSLARGKRMLVRLIDVGHCG